MQDGFTPIKIDQESPRIVSIENPRGLKDNFDILANSPVRLNSPSRGLRHTPTKPGKKDTMNEIINSAVQGNIDPSQDLIKPNKQDIFSPDRPTKLKSIVTKVIKNKKGNLKEKTNNRPIKATKLNLM